MPYIKVEQYRPIYRVEETHYGGHTNKISGDIIMVSDDWQEVKQYCGMKHIDIYKLKNVHPKKQEDIEYIKIQDGSEL